MLERRLKNTTPLPDLSGTAEHESTNWWSAG